MEKTMNAWPIKKLGEVCELVTKGTTPKTYGYSFTSFGVPFLRAEDIKNSELEVEKTTFYISPETHNFLSRSKTRAGDVLITIAGTIGRTAVVREHFPEMNMNQAVAIIRPLKSLLDSDYLSIFLTSSVAQSQINSGTVRAAIPNFSLTMIKNLEIPLPSHSEQKRIVARVKKLLGKIKEAKKLRAESLEATQNLLPAELHKIFEEGKRKKGWEEKILNDVLEKIVGGGTPSKADPSYWGGEIPWASVKDIKEGKYILNETRDYISQKGLENSSANLIPKGIIIISTRMGLGRVVKTNIDTAINQDLKALFPKKDINSDFLVYFLISNARDIASAGTGATVSGIRLEYLRAIKILLPPPAEQKKIVARLDLLSAKVDGLKKLQLETADDLAALEKSILNQAFKG